MIKQKLKKLFRLWVYYTFTVLLLSSCVTEKQRQKICAGCKVISTDSVVYKTKEVLKDTFIYVDAPPVIQYIKNPCDSLGNLKDFEYTSYNNGVKNIVTAIGGVLVARCEVDSLKTRIQFLERTISEKNKSQQVREVTTNLLTGFQKFCIKFFWIICGLITIFVVYKIIRIYLKTTTTI